MNLDDVVAHLGEPDVKEALRAGWEESVATMPRGPLDFLDVANVRQWRRGCGLGDEYEAPLESAARQVAGDPVLRLLAWHGWRMAYRTPEIYGFHAWPKLNRVLRGEAWFFYLLLALASVPLIAERHRSMGVPERVTRGMIADVPRKCQQTQIGQERLLGMHPGLIYWFQHYVYGRAFTLGRLQFMLGTYDGCFEAYRHDASGQTVAIARAGAAFNKEGLMDVSPPEGGGPGPDASGPGAVRLSSPSKPPPGWTAQRRDDATHVIGQAISPLGLAVPEDVRLPRTSWRRVLAPGETILEIHIPPGGGMTPEACQASLNEAVGFFRKHFPDRAFTVFTCLSWICDPSMPKILPATSNLVRFQKEGYLFPLPCSDKWVNQFIFGHRPFDPATAPRDTSVQRAFLDLIGRGGMARVGGMFLLVEDLPRFGSHWYRSGWSGGGPPQLP